MRFHGAAARDLLWKTAIKPDQHSGRAKRSKKLRTAFAPRFLRLSYIDRVCQLSGSHIFKDNQSLTHKSEYSEDPTCPTSMS